MFCLSWSGRSVTHPRSPPSSHFILFFSPPFRRTTCIPSSIALPFILVGVTVMTLQVQPGASMQTARGLHADNQNRPGLVSASWAMILGHPCTYVVLPLSVARTAAGAASPAQIPWMTKVRVGQPGAITAQGWAL
ncbi:hypothetical protein B0I35DRAFT_24807 [Stachybotrys elegans]|uniref:Uncharacterized protein n=1 Tax=Stachybotrys elegans TaxID=80388 RepID=A0A8K0T2J0_9HYPO|nr:hypothetical protein B0I35DRAFT_24807 [Stachybotrys elegans]